MITLGIETSCDETSACILYNSKIASLKTFSQIDLHKMYGGVVPEIASRNHLQKISEVVDLCLMESGFKYSDINLVAYTSEPGLVGGLLTGILFAKGLALSLKIPAINVNHIHAHVFTCGLTDGIFDNFLCLLISGGHTAIYNVKSISNFHIMGKSIDDSIGEVFDKLSKALGFGYPGGPVIEQIAKFGNEDIYKFGIPLSGKDNYNFSLSGIKTEFLKIVQRVCGQNFNGFNYEVIMDELKTVPRGTVLDVANLCASFQKTVVNIIINRLRNTIEAFDCKPKKFVICGGAASNEYIRKHLIKICQKYGMEFYAPEKHLCTDNAAMIANLGERVYVKNCTLIV